MLKKEWFNIDREKLKQKLKKLPKKNSKIMKGTLMSNWNIVPFGKYRLKYFDEIKDIEYLKWLIGRLNNDIQISFCAEAIIKAINIKYKSKPKLEINNQT